MRYGAPSGDGEAFTAAFTAALYLIALRHRPCLTESRSVYLMSPTRLVIANAKPRLEIYARTFQEQSSTIHQLFTGCFNYIEPDKMVVGVERVDIGSRIDTTNRVIGRPDDRVSTASSVNCSRIHSFVFNIEPNNDRYYSHR